MAEPKPMKIEPLDSLTQKLTVMLWINVGIAAAELPLTLMCLAAGPLPESGDGTPVQIFATLGDGVLSLISVVTLLVNGIMLFIWLRRAYGNLMVGGVPGLKYTPFWCIAYWFVPFVNLVRPYQVVSEIWRASAAETPDASWRDAKPPKMFGWWWAMWILCSFAGNAAGRLAWAGQDVASNYASLIDAPTTVAAGLLLMKIVRDINHRQLHKFPELREAQAANGRVKVD